MFNRKTKITNLSNESHDNEIKDVVEGYHNKIKKHEGKNLSCNIYSHTDTQYDDSNTFLLTDDLTAPKNNKIYSNFRRLLNNVKENKETVIQFKLSTEVEENPEEVIRTLDQSNACDIFLYTPGNELIQIYQKPEKLVLLI